jgi:hypothetical protein
MMMMPDSPGKWKTLALAPVSKTVMVHIAFDGPVTDEGIKKAMLFLESALDWAPLEGSDTTRPLTSAVEPKDVDIITAPMESAA